MYKYKAQKGRIAYNSFKKGRLNNKINTISLKLIKGKRISEKIYNTIKLILNSYLNSPLSNKRETKNISNKIYSNNLMHMYLNNLFNCSLHSPIQPHTNNVTSSQTENIVPNTQDVLGIQNNRELEEKIIKDKNKIGQRKITLWVGKPYISLTKKSLSNINVRMGKGKGKPICLYNRLNPNNIILSCYISNPSDIFFYKNILSKIILKIPFFKIVYSS